MAWRDFYPYFPRSRPREAKGGIKAQSKRGAFAESWWGKRWIQVLESFDIGARLGRGRSYARRGQVLSIEIEKGLVHAQVQGSRPKPYAVTIRVKQLPDAAWKKVAKAVSSQALFAAKLLAGEMPPEIETVFQKADVSLFPARWNDLATECSCPDWSNPCKHSAAVFYLLGEEFDRDPFLIFRVRGMSREELFGLVGESAPTGAPAPEPLPADVSRFWSGGELPADIYGEVQVPPIDAALIRGLGGFPFWRGNVRFLEALQPVYREASDRGTRLMVAEQFLL